MTLPSRAAPYPIMEAGDRNRTGDPQLGNPKKGNRGQPTGTPQTLVSPRFQSFHFRLQSTASSRQQPWGLAQF